MGRLVIDQKAGSGVRVAGARDLAHLGLTLETVVRQIIALDHRVYSRAIHGHIGTSLQWERLFRHHPHTWRVVIDASGALAGYWQIASLRDEQFEKGKAGALNPGDLRDADYCRLDMPGIRNLYFVSICIDPAHRYLATQWALVDSFFRVVQQLAETGVYFDEVAAVSHSKQGRQICLAFGLKSGGSAAHRGEIFAGRFDDLLLRFGSPLQRRFPRLVQLYSDACIQGMGCVQRPPRVPSNDRRAGRDPFSG